MLVESCCILCDRYACYVSALRGGFIDMGGVREVGV